MVTTIEPLGEWYPAEDYHQEYWSGEGQQQPLLPGVIPPKLQKLRKSFQARVKSATAPAKSSGGQKLAWIKRTSCNRPLLTGEGAAWSAPFSFA